eukprot:3675395-Pyramimonas_sp.AAC.1
MGVADTCGRWRWGLGWSSPWGNDAREGCAEMGVADLRWSSLGGHDSCERCAEMGMADACGRCLWGLGWSSLWDHDA